MTAARVRRAATDGRASAALDLSWLASHLSSLIGPLRRRRLCVAYSGGLDSSVLLSALAQLRRRERFELRALHVNHQLQPDAGRWARAARARARALRVPFELIRVTVQTSRGESLEAAAREARYRALAAKLKPGELLLTAHHQQDQFETVLLALLRGSGVRGLSGMAAITPWAHTLLLRPLLEVGRGQLEAFAQVQGLSWSEDPSNADVRFDRNYLRRQVLPALLQRWPAASATAGRSAAHLAEAQGLLDEQARTCLAAARDGAALRVSVLRRLSLPRRRLALRHWIAERGLSAPDHRRLREIAGPMLAAKDDAMPQVRWQGGELRRHADRLFAWPRSPPRASVPMEGWDWRAQPWLAVGGGALGLLPDRHGELRLSALPPRLSVSLRSGGERLPGTRGRTALKDLLQQQGLAPWERASVPLLLHGGRILAVGDLWIDPSLSAGNAPAHDRGRLRWRRYDPDHDIGD